MSTINQQLNIPILPPGTSTYQPELYNGSYGADRSATYNYAIVEGGTYWRAQGNGIAKTSWPNFKSSRESKLLNACGGSEYSNLWGTNKCKDTCRSLFPSDPHLEAACKRTCEAKCNMRSKCPDAFVPTRANVCTNAGLNPDCSSPTGSGGSVSAPNTPVVDLGTPSDSTSAPPDNPTASSDRTQEQGMSKNAKIGIAVVVVLGLGAGAYFMLRKKK